MKRAPYIPGGIEGTRRVIIRDVHPQIDAGEYPVKRIVGDVVPISAIVFGDGHEALACRILHRHAREQDWTNTRLSDCGNDSWRGEFTVTQMGIYYFTIQGWIDGFSTWLRDLEKRRTAGEDLNMALLSGADLVSEAALRGHGEDTGRLATYAAQMRALVGKPQLQTYSCPQELIELVTSYPDLSSVSTYTTLLEIRVDRLKGRYSSWYEMFPRSASSIVGEHGTFNDCAKHLPVIASLGFDVLYLPPVHPIGKVFRKGRNNNSVAKPEDVGSPWAIGSLDGGHKAIHRQLGSFADFQNLVTTANLFGIEIAMDVAFQCAPDHPYVSAHPEWFLKRPDGTIQYAENPPKKYEDIYPLNFESPSWWELWSELKSVFVFWIEQGIKIFRVDNPHTKAFPFWKWVLEQLKDSYPDTLFLAEAFTRPYPMYELAKLGYSQSYTYFTWRNTKEELINYLTELTTEPVIEFFRPNFWPNTPDILPFGLQHADPQHFAVRLILAATLSASYGIYGSAFELYEHEPRQSGSEEYLDSEKYELKQWNADPEAGLRPLIRQINRIRAENSAFQANGPLTFHVTDCDSVLAYSKMDQTKSSVVLVVIDLDPGHAKETAVTIERQAIGCGENSVCILRDLLFHEEAMLGSVPHIVSLSSQSPARIYNIKVSIEP